MLRVFWCKTFLFQTKFKGTVRFAPVATHKQQEIGRKDDCESWAYMVVDLLDRNRLPWQEVDRRRVEEMKVAALANPQMLFPSEKQKEMASIIR
jgi:tau tubulin kinase